MDRVKISPMLAPPEPVLPDLQTRRYGRSRCRLRWFSPGHHWDLHLHSCIEKSRACWFLRSQMKGSNELPHGCMVSCSNYTYLWFKNLPTFEKCIASKHKAKSSSTTASRRQSASRRIVCSKGSCTDVLSAYARNIISAFVTISPTISNTEAPLETLSSTRTPQPFLPVQNTCKRHLFIIPRRIGNENKTTPKTTFSAHSSNLRYKLVQQ